MNSIKVYKFAGQNQENEPINGTIEATTPYLAYKRLRLEFKFDIEELYLNEIPYVQESIERLSLQLNRLHPPSPIDRIKLYLNKRKERKFKKRQSIEVKKKVVASPIYPKPPKKQKLIQPTEVLNIEISSFIGWLLFFYVSYFFLASFSIEKSIGLNRQFVEKSLNNPIILNVTILLFFTHFAFYLISQKIARSKISQVSLFIGLGLLYIYLVRNF